MTSLVLGKCLYVLWWTVKSAEQVRNQKFVTGVVTEVWGQSPQRSKNLYFVSKNNLMLGLFW